MIYLKERYLKEKIVEKGTILCKTKGSAVKVLLTGAAGSVGYQTLQKLLAAGNDVIALDLPNRRNRRLLSTYETQAQIVYGSITNAGLLEELICLVDAVIHLAAIIPPLADRNPRLAEQVNVDGTMTIVDTIKAFNPHCFLIYSSSVSVYGDRVDNYWIEVDDPLEPSEGDEYAFTKIRAEKLIRASKIPYTIFRLSAIMGGHPATDPLMFHMPLNTHIEIASTRDTAEALVAATRKMTELNGRTFNLGGGPRCRTTYREFLRRMFTIYGLNHRFLHEKAFAQRNFHCGWYADSYKLEEILHFQHDDLESYYTMVEKNTNRFVRFFSKIFSRPIIYFLMKKSEPLMAMESNDESLIMRFFGK